MNGMCSISSEIIVSTQTPAEPLPTGKVDPDAPVCIEGEIEFAPVIPQVWLLLDRSGSMSGTLTGKTRWDALGNVLLGDPLVPEDVGVVGQFEGKVAFSAAFYTTGSGVNGCSLSLESVALATDNYANIRRRYNKLRPAGGTPTAPSIAAIVATAQTVDLTGGPKILVLATDGAPGTCGPSESGSAQTDVETEVAYAFAKKISTFAISITSSVGAAHMQRVANLGVGLAADTETPAPYYTAESQDALREAFDTIISEVPRSCVFELNGDVDLNGADAGTVKIAGQELAYKSTDGWRLKARNQVEFVGASCTQVQAGEEDIVINFPCSVFKPDVVK